MVSLAARPRTGPRPALTLLGPAFVAAVAYVDPGNVATNAGAGADFGYLLVWVVVTANTMAVLVQYLAAKLGLVTGRSLPEVMRDRLPGPVRTVYWMQAELVAMATDLAEIIGGALGLWLLFGIPLPLGGLLTAAVSLALLRVRDRRGQRPFEALVGGLLVLVAAGFTVGLLAAGPDPTGVAGGLVPRLEGTSSLLLAAGILGATMMPHAIYLHSALARDRYGAVPPERRPLVLRAVRWDVGLAMVLAGAVNLALLCLAAAGLPAGTGGSIEAVHAALGSGLGGAVALAFAVGLLASGLAATAVGAQAGEVVLAGLTGRRLPRLARRLITLLPALALLVAGADPTRSLVLSQVALSFGIPFAVIPLVVLTARRDVMGASVNTRLTTIGAAAVAVVVVILNAALLVLTLTG